MTNHRDTLTPGQRFGRLVIIDRAGSNPRGDALWRCACDCGAQKVTQTRSLRTGRAASCGCSRIRYDRSPLAVAVRFWDQVDLTGDCWLWTGRKIYSGYGIFFADRRGQMAHRWAYERITGPIPAGLEIDHLCRVRACVNPIHLEAITHDENVRRSDVGLAQREKTHCPQGHEYTPGNTRVDRGKRSCRTCQRENARVYRAKLRANSRASQEG